MLSLDNVRIEPKLIGVFLAIISRATDGASSDIGTVAQASEQASTNIIGIKQAMESTSNNVSTIFDLRQPNCDAGSQGLSQV